MNSDEVTESEIDVENMETLNEIVNKRLSKNLKVKVSIGDGARYSNNYLSYTFLSFLFSSNFMVDYFELPLTSRSLAKMADLEELHFNLPLRQAAVSGSLFCAL